MGRILVISGDDETLDVLRTELADWQIRVVHSLEESTGPAPGDHCLAVIVDLRLVPGEGSSRDDEHFRRAFGKLRKAMPGALVVAMAPPDRVRELVMAVKGGASEYLTCPPLPDELLHVRECIERSGLPPCAPEYMAGEFWNENVREMVRSASPAMARVYQKVRQVAETRSTVLLTGETGVGKSFIARLLHEHSTRRFGPFVSVHSGAIPETLIESELFGHERGAFTGAHKRKLGRFEMAQGGTIFLDEVGTISLATQVKLLDVVQERAFNRVGGDEKIDIDVRIIAAANIDLEEASRRGTFRKDLYYRLNVFPIEIPPLRERREDIPSLASLFLSRFSELHGKDVRSIADEVLEAFSRYTWPGNVRELESMVERALIMETSDELSPMSFDVFAQAERPAEVLYTPAPDQTLAQARRTAMERAEREYLAARLEECRGRIDETARCAGISTRQLHKLMQKYGLRKEEYKHGS